jgi:hypothetical protein
MNQKILIWVLVVLVAVLAGTTIYFAAQKIAYAPTQNMPSTSQATPTKQNETRATSQSPNLAPTQDQTVKNTPTSKTANWKTYTNKTYGFSIKFPNSCNYTESNWSEGEMPGGVIFSLLFNSGECASGEEATQMYLNVAKGGLIELPAPNGMDPEVTKDIYIAGQKAKNYDNEAYVVSNGKYRFELVAPEENQQKIMEEIIKTLEFM